LVPPGDSSSLANAIKVLDENPQIRDKMRQNNLKKAKKFISWQESEEKFLVSLKKIMKTL
jgi:glycosyltransferase involved in cell wall biosynthesis